MTEAYSDTLELLMKYYGRPGICNGQIEEYGAQIPFNFNLIHTNYKTSAWEFERLIREFVNHLPHGEKIHANWVVRIMSIIENIKNFTFFKVVKL